MKKIIGIAGFKRSGKDTAATYFYGKHNYRILSFASPIKDMVYALAGDFPIDKYVNELKETPIPFIRVSYRKLAATLGTEWGRRMIDPNIWVNILSSKIGADNVVIPDVRFENEVDWIKNNGGIIIKIIRDTELVSDHVSEAGVDNSLVDYIIENNGTIEDLYLKLDNVDIND